MLKRGTHTLELNIEHAFNVPPATLFVYRHCVSVPLPLPYCLGVFVRILCTSPHANRDTHTHVCTYTHTDSATHRTSTIFSTFTAALPSAIVLLTVYAMCHTVAHTNANTARATRSSSGSRSSSSSSRKAYHEKCCVVCRVARLLWFSLSFSNSKRKYCARSGCAHSQRSVVLYFHS